MSPPRTKYLAPILPINQDAYQANNSKNQRSQMKNCKNPGRNVNPSKKLTVTKENHIKTLTSFLGNCKAQFWNAILDNIIVNINFNIPKLCHNPQKR